MKTILNIYYNQSRLGRRNPSADSLVAYICSFAYWIPFAYASSPLLKLSRHNPDDFFSFCTKLWYISEFLVENRPPPLKTKNKNFVKSFYHHLSYIPDYLLKSESKAENFEI